MTNHTCKKCGTCCKYIEFVVVKSDATLEFYIARGLNPVIYDDHIVVNVPQICQHLWDNNTCGIHDHKPEACKNWPQWIEGYPEPCIYGREDVE